MKVVRGIETNHEYNAIRPHGEYFSQLPQRFEAGAARQRAPLGLRKPDSSTPKPLKPLGYAIGPFGKSTLGDHNAFAPAVQGFDEFRGTGTNRALRRARTS